MVREQGALGEREPLVETGGDEVLAKLVDGGELEGADAEVAGGLDVLDFVVEEEGFFRGSAELVEEELVDFGLGLGHVVLVAPDADVEVSEPGEIGLHVSEDVVAHVGEDAGLEAAISEGLVPGEGGWILGCPHAGVPEVQLVELVWGEGESCVFRELLPELDAGEVAAVVGVAVGPVEGLKEVGGEAGDSRKMRLGRWVRGTAENHSVIEDNCAQTQFALPRGVRVW